MDKLIAFVVAAVVAGIIGLIKMDHNHDIEMAKRGMCYMPVIGSQFSRWQPCK